MGIIEQILGNVNSNRAGIPRAFESADSCDSIQRQRAIPFLDGEGWRAFLLRGDGVIQWPDSDWT